MKYISIMIKPASGLCNMRCLYCFYADVTARRSVKNYGIMTKETTEKVIRNVLKSAEPTSQINFAFQGGEPTLAGLDYFENFVETVDIVLKEKGINPTINYALQTNGYVIDEAWCLFLAKHNFLVGLSLDGDAAMHDANRIDANGKGTHSRILASKKLMDKFKVEYNVLFVLTNHNARYPQKVWNFLRKNDIQYVQFIPCLDDLDSQTQWESTLQPQRFASFYITLFDLWQEALSKNNYHSVKFFDDLFNLIVHRRVTACGFTGQCHMQYIVEADGGVYPCDFYVLDQWRCGDLCTQTLEEIAESEKGKAFVKRERTHGELCDKCRWKNMCGGGCVRMKHSMYLTRDGSYCGYKTFLDTSAQKIEYVAQHYLR